MSEFVADLNYTASTCKYILQSCCLLLQYRVHFSSQMPTMSSCIFHVRIRYLMATMTGRVGSSVVDREQWSRPDKTIPSIRLSRINKSLSWIEQCGRCRCGLYLFVQYNDVFVFLVEKKKQLQTSYYRIG